jgi:hypothetical protein
MLLNIFYIWKPQGSSRLFQKDLEEAMGIVEDMGRKKNSMV